MSQPQWLLGILLGMLSAAWCVAADEDGWIEIAGRSGHLQLEAEVNGEPAKILLDTGADGQGMSREFAERAGIDMSPEHSVRIRGAFGQVPDREVYRSGAFEVILGEQRVPLRDFTIIPAMGTDIIIGRPFFYQVAVQIDYPKHRMRLFPSGAVDFESNMDFRRGERGELLVRADIHGRRAWLMVDTGSNSVCLLQRAFVLRHGLDKFAADDAQLRAHGVSRNVDLQMLVLEDVELGPFRFEQFLAGYVPEGRAGVLDERRRRAGSRIAARQEYQGILGYDVLRHFVITMDLGQRRIHFYPP